MAIEFTCNSCGKTLRVPDEHLGKKARCPACQAVTEIQPDSRRSGQSPESSTGLESLDKQNAGGFQHPQSDMLSQTLNPYASSAHPTAGGFLKPHRGGMVLTLGLVSVFCNLLLIPGILAWVWGSGDLKQMKAGIMDRQGEGLTMAGMVIGIIMTVIPLFFFALYAIFIVLMVILAAAG